ncbi:hypothetical protein [Bradyrhizobium cajani]|uniref:HPP family protein n=1 Tax=Bradyrhizobium cajani TaxID=1928661 RepID=A0A844TAK2_9BRAD|nr:hypothetical protein [Bradyrhizobium cajani]MCP3368443.1 hypothetical protein [Bradyrhizobium cajani]MVT76047.1 hypothetical protein [Bradyrhizobium cajani]
MSRLLKLQFLGPLALFVATLSAELAARALERAPSSETLWYLNLRVFGLFQRSHETLCGYVDLEGFQLFGIALPIFALACAGLVMHSKLPLAVSTQFAAGYAGFLLMSWQSPAPSTTQAALGWIAVPSGEGFYILAGILGVTLLSCVISHLLYLCPARAGA